jgi:hypothetical protein
MSFLETESFSSLRAIRRIYPSRSLTDFLSSATVIAEEEFEAADGFVDPLVYAADSLKVTLFERRLQASEQVNELLNKFYVRLVVEDYVTSKTIKTPTGRKVKEMRKNKNPLPGALRDVENLYYVKDEPMLARANDIDLSVQLYPYNYGTEFALQLDANEGPLADMLLAQEEMLYKEASRTSAGKKLARNYFQPGRVLSVPFAHLPISPDDRVGCNDFIELLSADLPVHNLAIGPLVWKQEYVSAPHD